jgi:hypothetical protein
MWGALWALRKPMPCALVAVEGTSIAKERNILLDRADSLKADWILFVDDDQVFDADALIRLLDRNVDLCGGLYLTRTPPHRPTAMRQSDSETGTFWSPLALEAVGSDGLEAVDALGMGFTLVRRAVWEAVPRPAFRAGQLAPDETGEDVWFCLQAKAAGFQPYVDTSVLVGHITTKVVIPTARGAVFRDRSDDPSGPMSADENALRGLARTLA